MRRVILLMLLLVLVLPAAAAKRMTVAELERWISTAVAAQKADAEIARQLAGMELSDRLTEATLGRLEALLASGSQAGVALELLADQSAFLDPPAGELPPAPAPSDQEQSMAAGGVNFDPADQAAGTAPAEWVNETVFTGYHRFAGTTRIITDAAPQ